VLVGTGAGVKEKGADNPPLLDAEREHDAAGPVGELLREPPQELRIAAAELVVDLDPAVRGSTDTRPLRAAEPRDKRPRRPLDRRLVVRLHEDPAEGVGRSDLFEPRLELAKIGEHRLLD